MLASQEFAPAVLKSSLKPRSTQSQQAAKRLASAAAANAVRGKPAAIKTAANQNRGLVSNFSISLVFAEKFGEAKLLALCGLRAITAIGAQHIPDDALAFLSGTPTAGTGYFRQHAAHVQSLQEPAHGSAVPGLLVFADFQGWI
jgi:hypothetical protein